MFQVTPFFKVFLEQLSFGQENSMRLLAEMTRNLATF